MILADARSLPFPKGSFDFIFTGPPWDNLGVLEEAKPELERVLVPKGRMALVLPHLDSPLLATLAVTNRDWSERQSFVVEAPREVKGPRYFSMPERLVEMVLRRFQPRRILDPFCGVGSIPKVARRLGLFAVGSDIDAEALACG